MSDPSLSTVDCEHHHTGLPVPDVLQSVKFYTEKLRFQLGFTWGDPPTMAGVNLGKAQIFLEQGTPNPAGCNLYFVVGDADELFAFQHSAYPNVVRRRLPGALDNPAASILGSRKLAGG